MSLNPFIKYTRVRGNSTSNVKISIFRIFPESYPQKNRVQKSLIILWQFMTFEKSVHSIKPIFSYANESDSASFSAETVSYFQTPPLNRQSSYSALPNKRPPPLCFFTLCQYRRIYRLRLKWPKRRSSFAEWCLVTHFCSNKVKFWQ